MANIFASRYLQLKVNTSINIAYSLILQCNQCTCSSGKVLLKTEELSVDCIDSLQSQIYDQILSYLISEAQQDISRYQISLSNVYLDMTQQLSRIITTSTMGAINSLSMSYTINKCLAPKSIRIAMFHIIP